MKKSSLLTPDDLKIKENIKKRKNKFIQSEWKKLRVCKKCGVLSINNNHACLGEK